MNPTALLEAGRQEVRGYGTQIQAGRVISATSSESFDEGFTVELEDGARVRARRLLVTTGLVDELPDVPGVRELWGATCCIAPTVMGGRYGINRLASWVPDPLPCIRRFCGGSGRMT